MYILICRDPHNNLLYHSFQNMGLLVPEKVEIQGFHSIWASTEDVKTFLFEQTGVKEHHKMKFKIIPVY